MRATRIVGPMAVAALMAMAIVGVTSAMAEKTALCSADESPCKVEKLVKSMHETTLGGTGQLLTSIGTIECAVLFTGTVTAEGNPLVISGNFTYTNCKLGSTNCTETEENGPSELKVLKEDHETAKVTEEILIHVVCGSSIDCSYTGGGMVGTAKGALLSQLASTGEVSLQGQSMAKEVGGFLCPKSAKLDITTFSSQVWNTYISSPPGMKCEKVGIYNGLYLGAIDGTTCKAGDSAKLGEFELVGA